MFARELPDGTFLMIQQEDHTDLSAQFAAHWGNEKFSRPEPYRSVVFGTIYHDSGHREMEADLPIDVERGVPFAIGRTPPGLRKNEADVLNSHWVRTRDPYAALLVSMHHAGLRKDRYGSVRKHEPDSKAPTLTIDDAFGDLEGWQREIVDDLKLNEPKARDSFFHTYRLLQVFDLLSLYFCRDGYKKGEMQDVTLERVPVASGSPDVTEMQLKVTGPNALRFDPYPFDEDSFQVCMMTRIVKPVPDQPEEVGKEAYYRAPRVPLTCTISR
jgi:hypothetical protein